MHCAPRRGAGQRGLPARSSSWTPTSSPGLPWKRSRRLPTAALACRGGWHQRQGEVSPVLCGDTQKGTESILLHKLTRQNNSARRPHAPGDRRLFPGGRGRGDCWASLCLMSFPNQPHRGCHWKAQVSAVLLSLQILGNRIPSPCQVSELLWWTVPARCSRAAVASAPSQDLPLGVPLSPPRCRAQWLRAPPPQPPVGQF